METDQPISLLRKTLNLASLLALLAAVAIVAGASRLMSHAHRLQEESMPQEIRSEVGWTVGIDYFLRTHFLYAALLLLLWIGISVRGMVRPKGISPYLYLNFALAIALTLYGGSLHHAATTWIADAIGEWGRI